MHADPPPSASPSGAQREPETAENALARALLNFHAVMSLWESDSPKQPEQPDPWKIAAEWLPVILAAASPEGADTPAEGEPTVEELRARRYRALAQVRELEAVRSMLPEWRAAEVFKNRAISYFARLYGEEMEGAPDVVRRITHEYFELLTGRRTAIDPEVSAALEAVEPERFPDGLIVSAVRYALGRATYVVSETTQWLREHWSELRPGTREAILRDVLRALAANDVGMDCDRREWESIAGLSPGADGFVQPRFCYPVLSAEEAAAQQAALGPPGRPPPARPRLHGRADLPHDPRASPAPHGRPRRRADSR